MPISDRLLAAKVLLALAAVGVIGCAKDDRPIRVYRTRGTVLVDGNAVEGAEVVLYSDSAEMRAAKAPPPTGETDADGKFELRTFDPGDGAPAGEFTATVFWPAPIPPGADEEKYEPQDRLGNRYRNPTNSGLVVTVPEGGGELPPLELSTAG